MHPTASTITCDSNLVRAAISAMGRLEADPAFPAPPLPVSDVLSLMLDIAERLDSNAARGAVHDVVLEAATLIVSAIVECAEPFDC
jgi:hypothetical protein